MSNPEKDAVMACQNNVTEAEQGTKTACFACEDYFKLTGKNPCLFNRDKVTKA